MKVSVEYAQEHLVDLLDTADRGEEIEIARADQVAYRLTLVHHAAVKPTASRVLGAGRGELRVPTMEEWAAMDKEIEREMCAAPLTTSGEI